MRTPRYAIALCLESRLQERWYMLGLRPEEREKGLMPMHETAKLLSLSQNAQPYASGLKTDAELLNRIALQREAK